MTLKQFKGVQMAVAVILGITFSQAIIRHNYVLPIIVLVIGTTIMLVLRRRVKEIIADERDYKIGGEAALLTIQIFSWAAAAVMLYFYARREVNPAYEPIGITLAYCTVSVMLLYSLIFSFKSKFKFSKFKAIYLAIMLIFFALMAIAGLRLFAGEDDWICKDGQWVEHGHPSFPVPTAECK